MVPSEHIFSSSSETIKKFHNQLQPEMIEALQMLKFLKKKERLSWMDKLSVTEAELIIEVQSKMLAEQQVLVKRISVICLHSSLEKQN